MWFIYSYLFIFTHFKSWRMCACKRSWHHAIQIIIVEITCLCFEKFYLIFRVSFVVWWGNLWMGHLGINTLWPSDTIWQCRSGLKLAQVMACCLLAPSHYLNQCCLIIKDDMWHSWGSHLTRSAYELWRLHSWNFYISQGPTSYSKYVAVRLVGLNHQTTADLNLCVIGYRSIGDRTGF